MPRRGENIRKRKDGRWEARILSADGKHRSVYAKSYADLKEKLKLSCEEQEETNTVKQVFQEVDNIPFEQLCNEWIEETQIKNKQSTVARYREIVKKHLLQYFKNTPVTRDSVNAFILYKTGQECLQEKTIYDIVTVLMQIIKYGEKRDLIHDFISDISRPTVHKKELEVLTKEEQEKLVSSIKAHVTYENIGILLSLYAGLRLGEICALQWQDIDVDRGTISVTKTMQRIQRKTECQHEKTVVITDSPKSQNSIRTIPIPNFLREELKRLSNKCSPASYVLTAREDQYIEPRAYQYKFKKYLEKAEIRNINFHALRHTFATRAVEQNIDVKVLSEILGHATVNFTLDRYVHLSFSFKKQNMEKLNICY